MSDGTPHAGRFPFEEEAFLRRIPHPVEKLNVPGAYAARLPTIDFDVNTMPPGELVRHGLTLRRPDPVTEPRLRPGWDKVFGRKWLARDRVIPHLVPAPRMVHHMRRQVRNANGNYTDNNWAGAAFGGYRNGGPWTTVVAIWNIPTVSQPTEPPGTANTGWQSSSWIGIDGYNGYSYDVLQVGVDQYVDLSGTPSYNAWVEWFVPPPNPPPPDTPLDQYGYPIAWIEMYPYILPMFLMGLTVSAGDQVSCSAQYTSSNTAGTLTFANLTSGQHMPPITLAPPPGATLFGNSVEWILEAPGGGEPGTSLPSFTPPLSFTWAIGCRPEDGDPLFAIPGNSDTLNIAVGEGETQTALTSVVNDGDTSTITFIG